MVRRVALGGLLFGLAAGGGLSVLSVEGPPRPTTSDPTPLRLNDLQVLGSHNSYKAAIDSSLMQILRQRRPEMARALAKYMGLFHQYDSLVGMEVHNQTDRYPWDRRLWDALLETMMPERPVWGFANDDSHG
ncbi:MAG: Ca2+-dependent phosphoinositide-specific phospholipase C [Salinibacter sp.]